MKNFRTFLLIEALILLVTFSLQIWALHILALSCSYAHLNISENYQNVPFAQLYTGTEVQVVTGYQTTSTLPASISVRTSTYTEVPLNLKTFTTTQRDTAHFTAQPIGYSPTSTFTRTVATTGLQDVRAGGAIHETYFPSSYIFLQEALKNKRQNKDQKGGVSIFPTAVWSLDTSFDINKYRTLTNNHGFGKHFVEAGIDYNYENYQGGGGGYSRSDYARIAGLTTLMACSIFAILVRLSMTTIWIITFNKKEKTRLNKSQRKTFYANLAATILLIISCLTFWIIYSLWTHISSEWKEAYIAIKKQNHLVNLGIAGLFEVEPWKGTPIALIIFSCISCLTSVLVCIMW